MTHICVGNLSIIGSDNGLSPARRQAIIWTNAGILSIRSLGTHFTEILSKNHTFSFKKMHLKTSSAKWRPSCLGLNVLMLAIAKECVWYTYIWNTLSIKCVLWNKYSRIATHKANSNTIMCGILYRPNNCDFKSSEESRLLCVRALAMGAKAIALFLLYTLK